jgi:hypothetical protein
MYPGNSDGGSKPPSERWGASLVVKEKQCLAYTMRSVNVRTRGYVTGRY